MYRVTKLRFRRRVRHSKRQVEDISSSAEEHFDKHFIKRLLRLAGVRRFVTSWLFLMVLLCGIVIVQTRNLVGYYQSAQPVAGGIHSEGMVGAFTNANPLFATNMVDSTVSKLVFSGLLKYDQKNRLITDLAQTWSLDEAGTTYTLKLKTNLSWHDGAKLTADDVVFTFETAQNPDVKSPLFQSWREVVVKKVDNLTITITLKAPFAPFAHSLTTGIVPKHLLEKSEPSQRRSLAFNTNNPVGSGPFKWGAIEVAGRELDDREQHIGLVANKNYHLGAPKIDRFILKAFVSNDKMLEAFTERQVDAVVGLDRLPNKPEHKGVRGYETPLTAISMAFFLSDTEPLKDVKLRSALVQAADTPAIIKALGYPVIKADGPFLKSSFAYDPKLIQPAKNVENANKLLDEAGWPRNSGGQRQKSGADLSIKLLGKNDSDNKVISKSLQQAWMNVGVKVDVVLQDELDLEASVVSRDYNVLLNAISLGVDPDVYAFWHSSQADQRSLSRLNFSNYSSPAADKAIDGGRTRVDPALRTAKYKPFLQAWKDDSPALAMYQPRFLYVSRGEIFNYNPTVLNSSTDRLNNVHNWMIRQNNQPIN